MAMKFRWNVGLLFVLGVLTAIGINVWRLVQPYTQPPPRPEFATEAKPKPRPTPPPKPKTEPSPEPAKPQEPSIGSGRVVPDIGLLLRDQPNSESGGSAGVEFNAQIAILEESKDGEWLKIRDEATGATGWVRSANIDRVAE
ncbi:MAG: SH3 domain-containing protein [Cyanobacteria bacterium KgW148]|nr:SH3 domain-containing protein [Cyanobacteria bacterium KgW148]